MSLQIAKKKGFLNQTVTDTMAKTSPNPQADAALRGAGFFEDIAGFFGGAVASGESPYKGHKYYHVGKGVYDRAVKLHQQNGGSFWGWLKRAGKKVAEVALPILQTMPGPVGQAANVAAALIPGLAPPMEGSGLSKAHYQRAKKHCKLNGCGFWDSVKATAKRAKAIAHKLAPHVQTGLDLLAATQAAPAQEGGWAVSPQEMARMAAQTKAQIKARLNGSGLKKGSPEAKARMAALRSLKKTKSKGAGLY